MSILRLPALTRQQGLGKRQRGTNVAERGNATSGSGETEGGGEGGGMDGVHLEKEMSPYLFPSFFFFFFRAKPTPEMLPNPSHVEIMRWFL